MNPNKCKNRPFQAKLAVIFAVALAAMAPSSANATVAKAASFDEKVSQADSILLGQCVRSESRLDPSGKWILTYSTFAVSKSLKGSPTGEVTLVLPGGSVAGLHQETIGVPSFDPGDTNVLFVKNGPAGPSVLLFDQGAYDVRTEGGQTTVVPVASDLVLLDSKTGKVRSSDEGPRTLRDFEREVLSSLGRTQPSKLSAAATVGSAAPAPSSSSKTWGAAAGDFMYRNRLVLLLLAVGTVLSTLPWLLRR